MRKDNRGFSLVELIVAVALLAIILVPVANFFTDSFRIQSKTSMKSSITRVGQYVMESFKNKDYLGLSITSDAETKTFDAYIQAEAGDFDFSTGDKVNVTGESGWELEYNKVKYNIDLTLTGLTKSDLSDWDIPDTFDATITINSEGKFTNNEIAGIECVDINTVGGFNSPNDGKSYPATYPTIVFNSIADDSEDKGPINILIKNDGYYDDMGSKQKYIRIVKGFKRELHVYIEGENLLIKEGQEGDGASQAYTRITNTYIGDIDSNKEKSSSEVLLDAEMIISYASDETIRDVFKFSFPVNYDFKEGE